jgi:hypothetical protein
MLLARLVSNYLSKATARSLLARSSPQKCCIEACDDDDAASYAFPTNNYEQSGRTKATERLY